MAAMKILCLRVADCNILQEMKDCDGGSLKVREKPDR